ncbi:hypothetical protein [Trichormus azollae]|uniref:hypothetical protein n=1 Tax=Trichormus azollae TaxID=1164 RepID=UPI00325F19E1
MSRFKLKILFNQLIENSFANAIIQTILIVDVGAFFSILVAMMTGTFVAEFSRTNKITNFVRFLKFILTDVPSIVVTMVAYGVILL